MIISADTARDADRIASSGPTRTVRSVLEQYRGARVIYPPHVDGSGRYVGNNGDLLIMRGVERLFESLELEVVASESEADLVVMCGGGGLRERGRWVRGILRDCWQRLRHLPLIVLPSSFEFPTQSLAAELGHRDAPAVLFCREAYSYLHLLRDHRLPEYCSVELDHDMAFELEGSPLLEQLLQVPGERILMVERTDAEHPETESGRAPARKHRLLKRLVPSALKPLAWRIRSSLHARRETAFRSRCEMLLREHYREMVAMPRRVLDVSSLSAGSFDFFCTEISRAVAVFTMRMHAGILGAMLRRPTVLFEGPYYKIRGVYEFSLRDRGTVRLEPMVGGE